MIKGNLLLDSDTFKIDEKELTFFSSKLRNLSFAVQKCRNNKDTIYGTGDLCYLDIYKYKFYQLCALPLTEIQHEISDFSQDDQLFLINYLAKIDDTIYETCSSFAELEEYFPLANNGMLGLEGTGFTCDPDFAVHDIESWHNWKVKFLSNNNQQIDWEEANHPYLPNLKYSNILLAKESLKRFAAQSHADFYDFAGKMAGNEKNAMAIEVGKVIAESNFYKYDDRVSKLNNNSGQMRNIYSLKKNGNVVYLSIDTENAAFEVCDHLGQHQGQFPFDGGDPKEVKSDHGIIIE